MTRKRGTNDGLTQVGRLLAGSSELASRGDRIDHERWRRIVGERVAERTRPGKIQCGVLTVYVASSVWAQELSLLSSAMKDRLAEAGFAVDEVRFRVGDLGERVVATPSAPPPARETPKSALPDDLARRLERVEDPALRAVIAEAAAYSLGRRAARAPIAIPRDPRDPRSAAPKTAPPDPGSAPPLAAPKGTAGKRER
ncbi:MAG TPA: DciA family protein [Polyangiaceae bacterium]|nr:DciA family protein [Polyangiaceae bacterium]